jgi:hypothetical protein
MSDKITLLDGARRRRRWSVYRRGCHPNSQKEGSMPLVIHHLVIHPHGGRRILTSDNVSVRDCLGINLLIWGIVIFHVAEQLHQYKKESSN